MKPLKFAVPGLKNVESEVFCATFCTYILLFAPANVLTCWYLVRDLRNGLRFQSDTGWLEEVKGQHLHCQRVSRRG